MMGTSHDGTTKALDHFRRVGGYCKIKISDKSINLEHPKEGLTD